MSKKFRFSIKHTITRVIEVEADTLKDARRQIEDYGDVQAWSDYPTVEERIETTVRSAR